VHLGTGMLSENPEAVRAFERAGIKNIGATSDQIEIASDKIKTIHLAKRLGIPVILVAPRIDKHRRCKENSRKNWLSCYA